MARPERTSSMYALTLSLDGDFSVEEDRGRVISIPSSCGDQYFEAMAELRMFLDVVGEAVRVGVIA